MTPELEATLHVLRALEGLGVPCYLGGSFASSLHGVPRLTHDADIVADLRPEHVDPLVAQLQATCYVDEETAADAVRQRASFNVIHWDTVFKVDIFVVEDTPYARSALGRRRAETLSTDPECLVPVATPEDVILAKLTWYRQGGEVSDRQWSDLVGVLKVQGDRLDREYLARWAAQLGVSDLLTRAESEAGPSAAG